MKLYKSKKHLFFSLMLHALFLLAFIKYIMPETFLYESQQKKYFDNKNNEININLSSFFTPKTFMAKISSPKNVPIYHSQQKTFNTHAKQSITQEISHQKNIMHDKILMLLHEAIAEKQFYPEDAIELNQTGKVTIEFLLMPDGTLSRMNILETSHSKSLDAAALAAVIAISPIKSAGAYLKAPEFFTVDVMFER